jgi:AgrD protein
MKNLSIKLSGIVAALALMVTSVGVNSCMFIMHQPKQPKGAEKLRKY